MTRAFLVATVWLALLAAGVPLVAAQSVDTTPARELTHVQGSLYRLREGRQHTVVLITPDGIVVVDPLSRPTAVWLNDELARRFPGVPVTHVVHTHHHFDRAEGASIFNRTAELVGHQSFNTALSAARRVIPPFLRGVDLNGSGRLDRAEINASPAAPLLATRDRDGDGSVTPAELYSITQDVESGFDSTRTITVGSRSIRLVHVGPGHAPDLTVVYFPEERLAFAVDPPPITAAPFVFETWHPRDASRWLEIVSGLEATTVLTGEGASVSGADLAALAEYVRGMTARVTAGFEAGMSLAELAASDRFDAFAASPHYAARSIQIADIYRTRRWFKADISGTAVANYAPRGAGGYCASYDTCTIGGAVAAGTGSMDVSLSRRMGVVFEMTFSQQAWTSRTSPLYDEELAVRETTGSVLGRISALRSPALSLDVVAGLAHVVADARGMNRVREALPPFGGRHPMAGHTSLTGWNIGATLARPFGRFTVVAPVRVIVGQASTQPAWFARMRMHAGVGMAVTVFEFRD